MPQEVTIPTLKPLWYQVPSWMSRARGIKRKITSYPRRHGKDIEDLSMAATDAFMERGTYYYVFPTRAWGERAIWDSMAVINGQSKSLIEWMFPDEFCTRYKSDLRVEIRGRKGTSLLFMGGSDNLSFVGQGGQGYTLSEFSIHREDATGYLAPIIRQSQAYLRLNGTIRGKNNQLYRMLMANMDSPEWFATWLRPEDTKLYCWLSDEHCINPELEPYLRKIDPRTGKLYANCQGVPYYNVQWEIDSGLISYAMARQEYINAADGGTAGAYYGYEMSALKKRGGVKPIDPYSDKVYTFWDIGGIKSDSDFTAIVFAHVNEETGSARVVDYYENTGRKRGHYFDVINQKGYHYGGHYAPHDAKRTNAWTGENMADTAKIEYGTEVRFVPKTQNTMNDIEICRRGFALTSFDSDRCQDLLEHLDNYHESQATGKPCHKNNCQECNGASHGADAFRTMQMAIHLKLVKPYIETGSKQEFIYDTDNYFIV